MDNNKYKYDVAFSFLAEDEALATDLNDLLQDRLSIFLYSKRQEDLGGTDGEKTFNAVFNQHARLVVVLYRSGWGNSPWTRIEETAIRNRAFEEGYDFVTFIPLDEPVSVPKWLPKTRLWIGLKRWGVTGAASVIEARVHELGGLPHEESIEDIAKRLEMVRQFEENRKQFLKSYDGVNASNAEYKLLVDEIERLLKIIEKSASTIKYSLKRAGRLVVVLGPHANLSINWQYQFDNSLDNSKLEVGLWEGHPPFPGLMSFYSPHRKKSITFKFDILKPETLGWKLSYPENREFDSKSLAEYILKFYMDNADPKQKSSIKL